MEKINDDAVRLAIKNQIREKSELEKQFDQFCSFALAAAYIYFGFVMAQWYFSL